jgi:hypothetical protein
MEYNRILKQHGKIYIEVPQPDCDRKHENNLNHYSILGQTQLAALIIRTGFNINRFENFEFDIEFPNPSDPNNLGTAREKFYCIVATKQRPLDIK